MDLLLHRISNAFASVATSLSMYTYSWQDSYWVEINKWGMCEAFWMDLRLPTFCDCGMCEFYWMEQGWICPRMWMYL